MAPTNWGRATASRLWRAALDLIFPPLCAGCGGVDYLLCPACRGSISWVAPPFCLRCGRALDAAACPIACPLCSVRPLRMDGVRAAVELEGAMRRAIHAFKYGGRTELAPPLAELMVSAWNEDPFPVDCIMPVPLHPARLRERGYDQAALLARELAAPIKLPVLAQGLERTRVTETQTRLSAPDRRKNVAGAFAAGAPCVKGRSVLLVDDVCTTGSTLDACAGVLRTVGAANVYAYTLARAGWDPVTGAIGDAGFWQSDRIPKPIF